MKNSGELLVRQVTIDFNLVLLEHWLLANYPNRTRNGTSHGVSPSATSSNPSMTGKTFSYNGGIDLRS